MKRSLVLLLLTLLLLGIILARQFGRKPSAPPSRETTVLNFYRAIGIEQAQFARFLESSRQENGDASFPVLIVLKNAQGDCLVDDRVIVRWTGGEYRLLIGKSGVLRFMIDPEKLDGLSLLVPKGYEDLEQRSIPLGPRYRAEEDFDATGWIGDVIYDGEITHNMVQQLQRIRAAGDVIQYEEWSEQLRRRRPRRPLSLPEPPSPAGELTTAEIYAQARESVVVIGQLSRDGTLTHAGGVILDPSGVIATAYHVLDKGAEIVSRGVRLADGSVHPIVEILTADQADDVALLRIDAQDLAAAPLSPGDVAGTPVTILSHPAGRFFTLTHGHISRYSAVILYARPTVKMTVTAEFADGSSGAPIFNPQGAVAGLVSSTEAVPDQMVFRSAVPAQLIARMVHSNE